MCAQTLSAGFQDRHCLSCGIGKESRDWYGESTHTIRYEPVGLEVNMRFIRFAIGALLIVGATILLCLLFTIGLVPALGFFGGSGVLGWVISVVIVVIAYAGGVWLVRKNRP